MTGAENRNELIIKNRGRIGTGSCINSDGREFCVIRNADNTYSLQADGFRWIKDGVKKLSTIQRFVDKNNYGILIREE